MEVGGKEDNFSPMEKTSAESLCHACIGFHLMDVTNSIPNTSAGSLVVTNNLSFPTWNCLMICHQKHISL